ncbi:MAG: FAD-dependent oxidoreductase [Acidimicrobiales bacterium]
MSTAPARWAIVGGGMLGLTLAHRLAQAGQSVTVIEGAEHLGGLAGAWSLGPVVWDKHYHVTLLSDERLRRLLAALDLEATMEWVETRTGCYAGGQLYSVSNSVEFLRFPALALTDKLRLGGTIFYGSKVRDWARLEQVGVEPWLARWSGRRTFDRFWLPLLRAKLGESYRQASAAFIWATIQRLYAARRSGLKKEMFGYVPGGYARILERFAEVLASEGVELALGAPVTRIERGAGAVEVTVRGDDLPRRFDQVVVTANASIAGRLVAGLTDAERARLGAVRYQGIVCASVLLEQPLSPFYLTYITDEAPFTAVVEMSAFVDRAQFGGRSLVYLPKYCDPADPFLAAPDEDVEESFLSALEAMYPSFRRDQVAAFRVSRVREVFAIPTLGYSTTVPPMRTSVEGVHLVTSAQIVNGTLNVNETVQLAERAVPQLLSKVSPAAPRTEARRAPAGPLGDGRPLASLSIDLDDLWSYVKTHGDRGWETFPTFLDVAVPRVLRFFDERQLALTWFIVGKDAELARNRRSLAAVSAAGHEVGNHSYLHEPWLHRYAEAEVERDVGRAEEAIEAATGIRPAGFRGPGYSLSDATLEVLQRRGYRYDASTLPAFTGPLARAVYFRQAHFSEEERALRADLFGTFRDGTRPLRPYHWRMGSGRLLEIPVTTLPYLRTPVNVTYLLYLSERSAVLADRYWDAHLRLCRRSGIEPSVLLHSHDFIGAGDVDGMPYFPGINLPPEVKQARIAGYLDRLQRHFEVVPMGRHAETLAGDGLRAVEPRFFARSA